MVYTHYENLLLIDIETVSQYPSFHQLPQRWQLLWSDKASRYLTENEIAETFYCKRAAVLAEFGKIICISIGYFYKGREDGLQLRIRSFYGDDEKRVLLSFMDALNRWHKIRGELTFCGHNIKEFDLPYICRRLLIHALPIPPFMDFQNMKPWETNVMDTMQLWRFGDYKNYISLDLLAACLGIDTSKDDMNGSMVGDIYWKDTDLLRIVNYCQEDVFIVGQIVLRMQRLPLLKKMQVQIIV